MRPLEAARSKRTDPQVAAFSADFESNIQKLRTQLLSCNFEFGNYYSFVIRDPKVRTIWAASFPERVLHHAVIIVCENAFDSYLIFDSYACRKNKGNLKPLERSREFCRQSTWHLKLDISKYFDNIDHAAARLLLERRFADGELLHLFSQIIDSYHTLPGKGVPIGALFSQYMTNHYLGFLDHWLKEDRKWRFYLRFRP
ncbi:MAG: RNA-directed DNA polymerase [Deltaproteobacteria bacterium]|nr:RNA-directed DNA polymerase [Deltaproteobacteria bacterium]